MITDEIQKIAYQYLNNIRRSGATNIKAECPFHTSDDPNGSVTFSMSLENGLFHCFSCGVSGNLRTFLRKMGSNGFLSPELSEQIRLSYRKPTRIAAAPIVADTIPEYILGAFDMCPTRLLKEGFRKSTLSKFEVGFDQVNYRITYPIRNHKGQLIGISGRNLDESPRKYKFYEQELLAWGISPTKVQKGSTLWNLHRVLEKASDDPLVLVEGYKACMWVDQAGYESTSAIMGNEITDGQRDLLVRNFREVVIFLDGNEAGIKGTIKTGRKLTESIRVRVATPINEEKQPDNYPPTEVLERIRSAEPFHLWIGKVTRCQAYRTLARWQPLGDNEDSFRQTEYKSNEEEAEEDEDFLMT